MKKAIALVVLLCAGYIMPAYFLQREEIGWQFLFFGIEFALYWYCIKNLKFSFWILVLICFLPRLVWIGAQPALSDDFYRFYWDGALMQQGMDVYSHTPAQLMKQEAPGIPKEIFQQLNSPNYYSAYPPLNQLLFYISASGGSITSFIIISRILILLADLLVLYLIYKLTCKKEFSINPVLAYGLNPLVITELTGNLHVEGVCMSIWLLAVWFLYQNKHWISAGIWALACGVKLIPMYLVAAIWPAKSFSKAVLSGITCVAGLLLAFFCLTNTDGFFHFTKSVGLYFDTFEFNASVYFLVREIGILIKGYNPISVIGPTMGIVFLLCTAAICYLAVRKKITDIFLVSALIIFTYYLLSTTVHPWYTINLLIPGILAGLRFPIAWTGLIFLSYVLYSTSNTSLYYMAVSIEYITLLIVVFYEWRNRKGIISAL